jgi:enhancing lycopene biosynthesis protein 2
MKIGVLLSGCGVYDGAEIQEALFSMLAIEEIGGEVIAISINENQHHVVNHITGEEMNESRNMLVEAARIARGDVRDIDSLSIDEIDALVIPGGFGSAKNLTNWAFEGPAGIIHPSVKKLIVETVSAKKPLVALCVSPVVVAKALEDSSISSILTIGSVEEASPYDISGFSQGLESLGATTEMKTIREINIDRQNKIITAPCYMMEASLLEVRNNIQQAIQALKGLL